MIAAPSRETGYLEEDLTAKREKTRELDRGPFVGWCVSSRLRTFWTL